MTRAIESYQARKGIPVFIPKYEVEAEVGFSVEYLAKRYGSLKPVADAVRDGRILGIVNMVGCNNPKVPYEKTILDVCDILLKNNVLILTNGCASFPLMKMGYCRMSDFAYGKCGEGLREFLKPDMPPVWHELLLKNNIIQESDDSADGSGGSADRETVSGAITEIRSANIDGNTIFYIKLDGGPVYYTVSAKDYPMLGYILLKKPWYDVLAGVIKAIVGYLILTVGSTGLVSNFRPVLVGLRDVFNINAMVIDPYFGQNAVTSGVEAVFGKTFGDAMILLLIAFIVNIILVRFSKLTKLRALFTTGHVQVQQAATAYWLILFALPGLLTHNVLLIVVMAIILGCYWAVGSNLIIKPWSRFPEATGSSWRHINSTLQTTQKRRRS